MVGTMNIECIGEDLRLMGKGSVPFPHKQYDIQCGILKLPEDMTVDGGGDLIAVGENDKFLHCFNTVTGMYLGIFKNKTDKNHLYRHICELNIPK